MILEMKNSERDYVKKRKFIKRIRFKDDVRELKERNRYGKAIVYFVS